MEKQREIKEAEAMQKEIIGELEVLNSCYEDARKRTRIWPKR
jgi:hypothetical protein